MAEASRPGRDKPGTDMTPEERAELELALEEERERPVLPESAEEAASELGNGTGLMSPATWWRWGLAALVVLAIVLAVLQITSGGGAHTSVAPGSPSTPPRAGTR